MFHGFAASSGPCMFTCTTLLRYGEAADIGNQIACRWALACLVVTIRQCVWVTEQPRSSLLPDLPFIRFIMRMNAFGSFPGGGIISLRLTRMHAFKSLLLLELTFRAGHLSWMGALGSRSLKRTLLFGTAQLDYTLWGRGGFGVSGFEYCS